MLRAPINRPEGTIRVKLAIVTTVKIHEASSGVENRALKVHDVG
jgi:hypothetical protein